MANGAVDSPVHMVLSGIIPHVLEEIIEFACENAEELCKLAPVSMDWRMASERDRIWKPICQQQRHRFNCFGEPPEQETDTSPMYSRAKWKALYVRFATLKARMRKGGGVRKEPVQVHLQFDDDRMRNTVSSDLYIFIVCVDDNQSVLVYSRETAEMVNTLDAPHAGGIRDMEPDKSGKTLVTNANGDACVRIWDVEKGVCRCVINSPDSHPRRPTRFVHGAVSNRSFFYFFVPNACISQNMHVSNKVCRLILAESHWISGDVMLRAYDTRTGELMQSSTSIEGLGRIWGHVQGSSTGHYYALTCSFTRMDMMAYYALWDMKFLTCSLVVVQQHYTQNARRNVLHQIPFHYLSGGLGLEIDLSHTYCFQLPANANETDSVIVWDFNGAIKLQLQTTDGDRFHDVIISQRKLLILQAQSITVWCLLTGIMEQSVGVGPGEDLTLMPIVHKYMYDFTVRMSRWTRGSSFMWAYLQRVIGADTMKQQRKQMLLFFNRMDVSVQEPDSSIDP